MPAGAWGLRVGCAHSVAAGRSAPGLWKGGEITGKPLGVIYAEITQNYGRKGIWGSSQTSEGLADYHLGWSGGCRGQQELPSGRCRVGAMAWPRKWGAGGIAHLPAQGSSVWEGNSPSETGCRGLGAEGREVGQGGKCPELGVRRQKCWCPRKALLRPHSCSPACLQGRSAICPESTFV